MFIVTEYAALWKYDPEMYAIVPHQCREIQCHPHHDT